MLPYTNFLNNGTRIPHGTYGMDTPGYYRKHIFLAMIHACDMVRYKIGIPV